MTINDPASAPPGSLNGTAQSVRVWDPLVRVFHWGLVGAFAIAWLTAEEIQPAHELAGYALAIHVGIRIVWGFIGSRYARFAEFIRGPVQTLSYIGAMVRGRERRYLGHNPAGAAMIVALLMTLSGTALTGWLMEEPARAAAVARQVQIVAPAFTGDSGDAAKVGTRGYGRGETEGPLKEVHETLANLMLLLVALHVGGVALASFRHRENLPRAMVTGRKRSPAPGDVA